MNARLLLKTELSHRCSKNPQYSLRAFAQSLGMSHTLLSLVLSGKRELSKQGIEKITHALGLSPLQKRALLEQKAFGSAISAETDLNAAERISLDQFALISEWHHFALLSLMDLEGARWRAPWIAQKLSISEIQASLSMERLVRLGLVSQDATGRWKQTGAPLRFSNKESTAATRKFQKQLLEKAIASLEQDPMEERDHSSVTFAIDEGQIPYARERIRAFRRELMRDLESRAKPTRVYNLTVQLFPVSKKQVRARPAQASKKQKKEEIRKEQSL